VFDKRPLLLLEVWKNSVDLTTRGEYISYDRHLHCEFPNSFAIPAGLLVLRGHNRQCIWLIELEGVNQAQDKRANHSLPRAHLLSHDVSHLIPIKGQGNPHRF